MDGGRRSGEEFGGSGGWMGNWVTSEGLDRLRGRLLGDVL